MACVDIIIPTYNRAMMLPETLKSVQTQTFSDWRCFIAEDGETAATREAVEPFLQDKRFVFLPGKHAGTPAAPRNKAIRQGEAPFIAFLDDDDLWLPEKLEQQISSMQQHPECFLLSANAYRWDGRGCVDMSTLFFPQPPPVGKISFEKLIAYNSIITSTAIVSRQVLCLSGLLNEAPVLASCEDYDLWLRIAALGEVWIMDKALVVYRDAPHESIRAHQTMNLLYKKLACAYDAALRGDGTVPSPLKYQHNRGYARYCRNQRDFCLYQAGSFLNWRRAYFWFASESRNVRSKVEKKFQRTRALAASSDLFTE